jgi:competence protein ComEA
MLPFLRKYAGFLLLLIGIIGLGWMNLAKAEAQDIVISTTGSTTQVTTANLQPTTSLGNTWPTTTTCATKGPFVMVDIKGEVKNPGVYELDPTDRVIDAILRAGGLTENANVLAINLAKTLTDEMVIIVPGKDGILDPTTPSDTAESVKVDIKGEVQKPGVYEVSKNARVTDVLSLAGGPTKDADLCDINLARIVEEEMVIAVPKKKSDATDVAPRIITVEIRGEVVRPGLYQIPETYSIRQLINDAGGLTFYADTAKIQFDQYCWMGCSVSIPRLDPASPIIIPENPDQEDDEEENEDDESGLININTATLDELMALDGIGIVLGQRIIDYRAEYGDFQAIEEIMRVSGIKDSVYAKIKDDITVGDR